MSKSVSTTSSASYESKATTNDNNNDNSNYSKQDDNDQLGSVISKSNPQSAVMDTKPISNDNKNNKQEKPQSQHHHPSKAIALKSKGKDKSKSKKPKSEHEETKQTSPAPPDSGGPKSKQKSKDKDKKEKKEKKDKSSGNRNHHHHHKKKKNKKKSKAKSKAKTKSADKTQKKEGKKHSSKKGTKSVTPTEPATSSGGGGGKKSAEKETKKKSAIMPVTTDAIASDYASYNPAAAADNLVSSEGRIAQKVNKIAACKGATAVTNESTIRAAGFAVEKDRLYQCDYSQVFKAVMQKSSSSKQKQIAVKVINLTECSPRFRANLLQTSVRILRFLSSGSRKDGSSIGGPTKNNGSDLSIFIKTYDIFLVSGVKLFIFMAQCDSTRSMYDLVRSADCKSSPADIRRWFKDLTQGVHKLQTLGVAHRAIKLQHILFDFDRKTPKLCGWSKATLYYDATKRRILLQRKERRVRRNYHLPPEAFTRSYDPSRGDIWSLGVMLVAMCTKRYPFNVRDSKTKFSSQWREFIRKHEMNTFVRNLCHRIFVIDPKKRITTRDILKEKYFLAPSEKLATVSCKADFDALVQEDSLVGGVSMVDFGGRSGGGGTTASPLAKNKDTKKKTESKKKKQKDKIKGKKSAKKKATQTETEDDSEAAGASEQQTAPADQTEDDTTGTDDNATGDEGGNVGEEENLPPAEQEFESQMAEKVAPEEAEAEAQPEDGGEGAPPIEGDDDGGNGGADAQPVEEEDKNAPENNTAENVNANTDDNQANTDDEDDTKGGGGGGAQDAEEDEG